MPGKASKRYRRNRERKRASAGRFHRDAALAFPNRPASPLTTEKAIHVRTPAGPHVVVALATMGRIHEQTLSSLQAMIRATRRCASLEMWWQNAYPGGKCRNLLVERFLADHTKTHLLFVDTDMGVPERGLDVLLETGEPLVCGPAPICLPRKGPGPANASPHRLTSNIGDTTDPALRGQSINLENGNIKYTWRDAGGLPDTLFPCDVTGMSFCLIAREVLERMTPPWFYFVDRPDRTTIGVDVYFFRKARQLGYRVAVHPDLWCDHLKETDLTHIEQLTGVSVPGPRWDWRPAGPTPRTMVVACTTRYWLAMQTAEVLLRWQDQLGDTVGIRLVQASDAAWALNRALREPAVRDPRWERIMLLGPDIVPPADLLQRLGSIDAPIVSTISRGLIAGKLAYTFALRDAATGRVEYPQHLPRSALSEPFDAHSVDIDGSLIRAETCKHVPAALHYAIDRPDPTRAFSEHFADLVRQETGRDPVVAPIAVERRADVGLLGLLRLKQQMQTRAQAQAPNRQPVCV